MEQYKDILKSTLRSGAIAGLIALSTSMVGMVELFEKRELISGIFTMGQVLFFLPTIALAYLYARQNKHFTPAQAAVSGAVHGAVSGAFLVALIILATTFDLRQFFVNVSPLLISTLTFDMGAVTGSIVLVIALMAAGVLASLYTFMPERFREPLLAGLLWTLLLGLLSEILAERTRTFFGIGVERALFSKKALTPMFAGILFLVIAGLYDQVKRQSARVSNRMEALKPQQKKYLNWAKWGAAGLLLALFPNIAGTYLSEVINNVGLFILMGLGLNIVVGFAGLLDLGYVAFFAIGAYMMGVLTSTGELGLGLSFWVALPICVLTSTLFGILLGTPVLRMRGDYLAIVTLGFGEIIRILAISDMLKPFIGGAQGILKIPKPEFFGVSLVKPEYMYYLILAGVLLAAYVAWRMRDSRLGRQWMALREDEDVAEAMGINLVSTKLMAFAFGAAFSGMSGAIFASKLTSIFPHSFNLMISINVLALIIVGGMGSLPGVVVGAFILVGLPELLREFAEFRLLMYGILLIVMMLIKPEGFWPSDVIRREMHHDEESPEAAS